MKRIFFIFFSSILCVSINAQVAKLFKDGSVIATYQYGAVDSVVFYPVQEPDPTPTPTTDKSIVILYENDVHCGYTGYTRMAGLRNAINQTDTAECIIVSCGDYLQGGSWGALSSGEYIVNIMNTMDYSAVTIGNHEFDYGGSRLLKLMGDGTTGSGLFTGPITCVNFSKAGSSQQYYQPYIMTTVAGKKIAFVGVVTPSTLSAEYYSFYDSDGNLLYDLYPDSYIQLTQQAVDDARAAGADYVFLLSHLGEQDNGYSSIKMINSTDNIDLVLDGHTHSVIPDSTALNKDGETIHFTQTGTQFANIGKLTISKTGTLHTELLKTTDIPYTDSHVDAVCDSINKLVSAVTDEKLGTSDHKLTIYDTDGTTRIVRNHECTAGNFAADAFRYSMNAEIGLVNGGGVRADLPAGDITYGSLVNVNPFFNDMEARQLTGAQLRSLLNHSYRLLPNENGSFFQVSGLHLTIDLTSGTPTITDVQVEDTVTGTYQPLDDTRTYTVGSTSYVFGLYSEISSTKVVTPLILKDAGALRKYFVEKLSGDMGSLYTSTEGRITIITAPTISLSGTVTGTLMDDGTGQVNGFDSYGMLVPSFKPSELIAKGFEYSDYLDVKIGDDISLHNVPFVTGFNEVGVLETCFCNYNEGDEVYGFGQLHGNFKERIGGKEGQSILVTLAKIHGYWDTWQIMKSVYDTCRTTRYKDETDEEFANFRKVTTTGMADGVLFRSSNPLNPKDNAVRFAYVDTLARHYGIRTEIDLADTDKKVTDYATGADYSKFGTANGYCYNELFLKGNTKTLGLTADTFGETFMETLGSGLKFMLEHQPPYLLHCNEGKDRCGFVSMLLEALAGATYQDVADDYMQTLVNFYQIKKDSESYKLRQQLSIDRLVWLLGNIDTVENFGNIDWTGKDPKAFNLQNAAVEYVKACGLSDEQCTKLQTILQTGLNTPNP